MKMQPFTDSKERKNMMAQLAANMKNAWNDGDWYECLVEADITAGDSMSVVMLSPIEIPQVPHFTLYWSTNSSYAVRISKVRRRKYSENEVLAAQRITRTILLAGFPSTDSNRLDFPLLFIPSQYKAANWPTVAIQIQGHKPAKDFKEDIVRFKGSFAARCLVRNWSKRGSRYIFKSFTNDFNNIIATKFPKKRDFLHKQNNYDEEECMTETVLKTSACTIDNLPASHAIFALFIPSVFRRLELAMLAEDLRTGCLAPVQIQDLQLVQTAITQGNAGEVENYERLEFLGDCVLKYFASIQLMMERPLCREGGLTTTKGYIVANVIQAESCIKTGVDRYIITDNFKANKWRPLYVRELVQAANEKEITIECSTKTLADVVEALIGASYVDGGISTARECIRVFFPTTNWATIAESAQRLRSQARVQGDLHLENEEGLVGYSFTEKSVLLEALTHPSCTSSTLRYPRPYDRLEFLGDAVLEYIVSTRLYASDPEIPYYIMHLLRSAVVNSGLLCFLCLDFAVEGNTNRIVRNETGEFTVNCNTVHRSLWQFMRHSANGIAETQQGTLVYYKSTRDDIRRALCVDSYFPWSQLIHFLSEKNKFFSDIIESIIGAIFIDSGGNIKACEAFVERIGLMRILRRLVDDEVDCRHPKNLLREIAVSKKVNYEVSRTGRDYSCFVEVGGQQVGSTIVRSTREEAEAEAAKRAFEILKANYF